jgi:hypothetical protein
MLLPFFGESKVVPNHRSLWFTAWRLEIGEIESKKDEDEGRGNFPLSPLRLSSP